MERPLKIKTKPNRNTLRVWQLLPSLLACFVLVFGFSGTGTTGEADIVGVKIVKTGRDKFRIDASVRHADTGWDHYANKFEVLDTEGNVLGTRILHHPHVDEQPFTRSLSLEIPQSITQVVVRAGDSQHEFGGAEQTIDVPH